MIDLNNILRRETRSKVAVAIIGLAILKEFGVFTQYISQGIGRTVYLIALFIVGYWVWNNL